MKRGPQAIGNVLSEFMARRGFARVQSAGGVRHRLVRGGRSAGGEVHPPRPVRRCTLKVVVANSTLVQELGFQKVSLLKSLANLLPGEGIENLRFRVGNIE